jgi:hypothetical protein
MTDPSIPSEPRRTGMPDAFDRQLAALHDLPDVTRTKPATLRVVPPLGVGGTVLFVVQTLRQREVGDTVFIEVVNGDGATRIVMPPAVAEAIARQRDTLTNKSRSRAGKERAARDQAAGIRPGFLRGAKKARRP